MSKKRKTKSAKAGGYAAIATNRDKSDAFTKAREVKRLESIDIQDDEDDSEATERSTTMENIKWDKVCKIKWQEVFLL